MDMLRTYGLFCFIAFMFPFMFIVPDVMFGADVTEYGLVVGFSWILALFFLGLCIDEIIITRETSFNKKNIVCIIKRTDQKSTFATFLIENSTWFTTGALAQKTFPH